MSTDSAGRAAAMVSAAGADRRRLRSVLARFATGVTVVTVGDPDPHGMTANAFTSVSLEPPLVLVCVKRDARLHRMLGPAGTFGVSVLGSDQERIARYFSHADRPRGIAQFSEIGWTPGAQTGVPLIDGAIAWLECSLYGRHEGGDHSIFLGRLVSVSCGGVAEPLLFYDGQFLQLSQAGAGCRTEG